MLQRDREYGAELGVRRMAGADRGWLQL